MMVPIKFCEGIVNDRKVCKIGIELLGKAIVAHSRDHPAYLKEMKCNAE